MTYRCIVCHFEIVTDDLIAPAYQDRGVCLSCLNHEVGDERKVSKRLQREIATEEDELRGTKLPVDPRLARLKGENA